MRKMFVLQAYVVISLAIASILQGCGGGQAGQVTTTPSPVSNPATIVMTTTTLPTGEADTAYDAPLGATGGSRPYTWKLASGELPPGVALASDGTVSGTPSDLGTYNFTVQVADASQPANSTSKPFGFLVDRSRKPTISNVSVSNITPTSAVISWTTDSPSDTMAFWGLDPGYGSDAGATDTTIGTKTHKQTITGLRPGNSYYYGVRSRGFTNLRPDNAKSAFAMGLHFSTPAAASTGDFDYWVSPVGPHRVVQGYEVYTELAMGYISGKSVTPSRVYVTVTGLPPNSTLHFPDMEAKTMCCGFDASTATANVYSPDTLQFEVVTTDATPVGDYVLHIHMASGLAGGTPTKDIDWPLTVEPKPSLAFGTPSSYPAIPDLGTWEANMSTYGAKWCMHEDAPGSGTYSDTVRACSTGVETCSWYYDGEKVYYQIADYRRKTFSEDVTKWNTCSQVSEAFYRDTYVIPKNGAIAAWRVFPDGLYMDYTKTGDAQSKTAVNLLAAKSPYSSLVHGSLVDPRLTRETAYLINSDRLNLKLGDTSRADKLKQEVAYALGQIDMWTVDKNAAWFQPFMGGLLADALIHYYEDGHQDDVRIPAAIKKLADWMWANAWQPSGGNSCAAGTGCFYYNSYQNSVGMGLSTGGSDMRNMNLLVAPMYAWVFKTTGDVKYLNEGDSIWQYGVSAPVGDGVGWSGKNFSQQYRWSFDYVKWRSQP